MGVVGIEIVECEALHVEKEPWEVVEALHMEREPWEVVEGAASIKEDDGIEGDDGVEGGDGRCCPHLGRRRC